jgi:hypothetical protein
MMLHLPATVTSILSQSRPQSIIPTEASKAGVARSNLWLSMLWESLE